MKRIPPLAVALVAAFALAGPSSATRSDLPSSRLSPAAIAPNLGAALDARLAQVALSGRTNGSGAALTTARSQGFLVAQGKLRVVIHARARHVADAKAAVRLAHGKVVITSGELIEALVPPKSLQGLAASRFVVRVLPVRSAAPTTMMGLRVGRGDPPAMTEAKAALPALLSFGPDAPSAPTDAVATAGDGQATVSFTPPASDGGDQILYYTATAYPGGKTASSTEPSVTVHGLTNGVTYTFTVSATNMVGTGAESDFTNSVTPDGSSRLDPEDPPSARSRPNVPAPPNGTRINPHQHVGEF